MYAIVKFIALVLENVILAASPFSCSTSCFVLQRSSAKTQNCFFSEEIFLEHMRIYINII